MKHRLQKIKEESTSICNEIKSELREMQRGLEEIQHLERKRNEIARTLFDHRK